MTASAFQRCCLPLWRNTWHATQRKAKKWHKVTQIYGTYIVKRGTKKNNNKKKREKTMGYPTAHTTSTRKFHFSSPWPLHMQRILIGQFLLHSGFHGSYIIEKTVRKQDTAKGRYKDRSSLRSETVCFKITVARMAQWTLTSKNSCGESDMRGGFIEVQTFHFLFHYFGYWCFDLFVESWDEEGGTKQDKEKFLTGNYPWVYRSVRWPLIPQSEMTESQDRVVKRIVISSGLRCRRGRTVALNILKAWTHYAIAY